MCLLPRVNAEVQKQGGSPWRPSLSCVEKTAKSCNTGISDAIHTFHRRRYGSWHSDGME